jgi:hypothetical protein
MKKERNMNSLRLRSRIARATLGLLLAGFSTAGCGVQRPVASSPAGAGDVPTTPAIMTGKAQLSGVVRDGDGNGVAQATVRVAETDASAMTDASGAYALAVPADSTLTLVATAPGFATTFRESIIVAEGATATGFDVLLLPSADVARVGALAPSAPADMRGLVAVHLRSLRDGCVTAGARVEVWPPLAATVLYGRPNATGGLDEVDPALSGVEAGARVDAWLAGAVPPGNMFEIRVDQQGCALTAQRPSVGGVLMTGQRRVDAMALTEIDLFLE